MDIKVKSNNYIYTCEECKNDSQIESESGNGDIVECQFCGIEYEIIADEGNGQMTLSIIEEEK